MGKIEKEELAFLKEYELLCQKYKMGLRGCGCCGSPWLCSNFNQNGNIDNINYDSVTNIIDTEYGKTIAELEKELLK